MITVKNKTGSKAVIISEKPGNVIAQYAQCDNGEWQVLQTKTFSTKAAAERWAKKMIP